MKSGIKFKTIGYFFYVLMFQILYIAYYYFYLDVKYNTIDFAIFHSIFSSIFMVWSINKLEKMLLYKRINYNYFINLILSVYFELSCVKYSYNHYEGFIQNNYYRLVFNIAIMLLLIIITQITDRMINFQNYKLNLDKLVTYLYTNSIFLFVITIIYSVINLVMLNTNLMNNIVIQIIVIQFFMLFTLIVNCANIEKNISKIDLIIILITSVYRSGITGKRNDIVVPIVVTMVYLLVFGKIKIKHIKRIVPYIGVVYIFMSLSIFKVSSRFDITSDFMKSYLGNRFDVTDMALTYFEKSPNNTINTNLIKDSLINATPAIFMSDKEDKYTNEYANANVRIGLKYNQDFGDTIVSMSTQIWPGYGTIIVLLIIYIINNFINKIFLKFGEAGIFMILLNLSDILNIEQTSDGFFSGIRNIIIVSIATYFIYIIFNFKTKISCKMKLN